MFTSAILWAVAASMKIFPCLLFAMFLAKRKNRVFGLALGGLIKALILLILLLTVLLVPMPSSFFADLCLPASDPKTEA